MTVEEYDRFISWLDLTPECHVLEVASGSGGPALYLANRVNCRVTGIDANENGVATATQSAVEHDQKDRVTFKVADANARLPFDEESFDAILCIDSMNHFPSRLDVFKEWRRVLRPGRRAVFTDPVVISGTVTNDELALRSSIGLFLFVPPGVNEHLIEAAGFLLIKQEDVTENAALVSRRWLQARQRYKDTLLQIEGQEPDQCELSSVAQAVQSSSISAAQLQIDYQFTGSDSRSERINLVVMNRSLPSGKRSLQGNFDNVIELIGQLKKLPGVLKIESTRQADTATDAFDSE